MILLIEILMLIAGIWAIVAGKLPSAMFGGAKYSFEGRGVRLLGLILVCPLAFVRANQALHLIDEHQVGRQHRRAANAARIIAPVIFLSYAAIAAIVLAIGISGL